MIAAFFLDERDHLQHWSQVVTPEVREAINGSLSRANLYPLLQTAKSTSRIASYWSSVVYQSLAGMLVEVAFNESAVGRLPDSPWTFSFPTDFKMAPNSSMAQAGMYVNTTVTVQGGWASMLFYQRDDGRLLALKRVAGVGEWGPGGCSDPTWTSTLLTDQSTDTLSQVIPLGGSIGAFSLIGPRSSQIDPLRTFAYVLWQDEEGILQLNWRDDGSSWKGPNTYPAFSGADKGTSIACVATNMWPVTNVQKVPGFDMCRCYFLAGGRIKEVQYTGLDWVHVGFVSVR